MGILLKSLYIGTILKQMPSSKHKSTGFTLVEIMVVITIVSILASSVLFATRTSRERANIAATHMTLREVLKAMELYRHTVGDYAPVGIDFCNICQFWGPGNPYWDALPPVGKFNSIPYTNGSWRNDIIAELDAKDLMPNVDALVTDAWGNEFLYDKNFRQGCFTWSPICSRGPNQILETNHCPNSNQQPQAGGDDICVFLQPR